MQSGWASPKPWSPIKMNKNLMPTTLAVETDVPQSTAPRAAAPDGCETTPKRGFKPRWLRLQRRERKLKEARALAALRPVVG